MLADCMLKKTKQQSPFMGVLTRSKTLALQRLQKESGEFLQLGSRRFKKQREGSLGFSKGKGNNGIGRKRKAEVVEEKGGVKLEEGFEDKVKRGEKKGVKDDLGRVNLVGGGVLDAIGGAPLVIDGGVDYSVTGGGGVGDSVIGSGGGGDSVIGGGGGEAAKGGVDGIAAISGRDGGEGAEKGEDFILGDEVLKGGSDRVTRESTPEHLIIRSDYIKNPSSSAKGAKAFADERPQTQIEVGGNSHQLKKLTTDLLLQENSNYAPSMEKYNFDFENEKPLPGRFEWEKFQR